MKTGVIVVASFVTDDVEYYKVGSAINVKVTPLAPLVAKDFVSRPVPCNFIELIDIF